VVLPYFAEVYFGTSLAFAVVWQGIKFLCFVNRSTITIIALNPLLSGNPVTKSIGYG
jgi:hypothetical protein